jgi:DNA-binding NarL/FixJ family response regulator
MGSESEDLKGVGEKAVLMYESHDVVRGYLQTLLRNCGFFVVASVTRKRDLPAAITNSHPDIILISHPHPLHALEAARSIRGRHSQVVLCTEGKLPTGDFELQALGIIAVVSRTVTKIGCLIGVLSRCVTLGSS